MHARKGPDSFGARGELREAGLTSVVIGAFFDVYNELGYGFLESVYRSALAMELVSRGLQVRRECPVVVEYKGAEVGHFRLDLLVENRLAVELKATELLHPTGKRQLRNYLRASTIEVGLLLHFGPEPRFHRIVTPSLTVPVPDTHTAP